MAVQIPVYVDIEGAFDRAVAAIPKEVGKLENVLSRHALNMQIDVGGQGMSLRDILTDTTMSADKLKMALKGIKEAYNDAMTRNNTAKKTLASVNNLAKAYGLVEQRIKGVYNANSVAAMRLEADITKVNFKLAQMKQQLATMTPGTSAFNKLNYEMGIQKQRLSELTRQQILYKSGVDAASGSLLKQSTLVRQLTGYFSGLYAAMMVFRFVKQIRDVTGELEYQRVALGHLLNDMQFGNELFEKTIEAAKESPFRITQLVTYTKQLAAYRVEQENLFDTTQRLADISAGLGVSMDRLILAYGQVRAASVLRGQELRQFTEAGIPLVEELSKKITKLRGEFVSTADVFKLISQRAIPFKYIKEIFEDLTNAGGMFYKMQQEQAKTLKGRWEKLKDAYDQALKTIGETDTFQSWNDTVLKILNNVAKNLTTIIRVANSAAMGWIAYKIAASKAAKATIGFIGASVKSVAQMIRQVGVQMTLKAAIEAVRAAWQRLVIAMKNNWVGLALGAVATLWTFFTTFNKKTKEATESITEMGLAIEKITAAKKEYSYTGGLISDYKTLSETVNKTAAENEHLKTVMEELKRLYPDISDKIGDENTALQNQIDLLNEAAEKRHEAAVEEAREQLKTQKLVIEGLEKEEATAKAARDAARYTRDRTELEEKKGPHLVATDKGLTMITAEELRDATIEAGKAAKVAEASYEEVAKKLADARNEAEKLEEILDPKKKTKDMQAWAVEVSDLQKSMQKAGDARVIFTDADLKEFTSLYDFSKKLKKRIDDLTTSLAGMQSAYAKMTKERKESAAGKALSDEIDDAKKDLKMAEAIRDLLGLTFTKDTKGYQQDPFIKIMENRIKFMKDFKKGYDDLGKYMSKSDALGKEFGIMKSRGLSLGINEADQRRAAEGLSEWYGDAISEAFEKAKKFGAGNSLTDFLSREITGTGNKAKALRDFQKLIQSLWDAKTDLDTSKMKKEFEDSLNKIKEEIKQSETARNFFNDIFKTTGDPQLAAEMTVGIYGNVGRDFRDNVQKELNKAMASFDFGGNENLLKTMSDAIASQDFDTILKYIDRFPEEWQKRLQEMADSSKKFSADQAKDLLKALQKAKTYSGKRLEIAEQTARRLKEIDERNISDGSKDQLRKQTAKKEADEIAKLEYEAFKDTPMYVELFANLDQASSRMLTNMRTQLAGMKDKFADNLNANELKEMQARMEEISQQLASRNPFKALIKSIKEYRALNKDMSRKEADEQAISLTNNAQTQKELLTLAQQEYDAAVKKYGVTSAEAAIAKDALDVQAETTDSAIEQANAAQETANSYRDAAQNIAYAAEKMAEWVGYSQQLVGSARELVEVFASAEDAQYYGEQLENLSKGLGGLGKAAIGIAQIASGNITPQAIVSTLEGLSDITASIFSASNAAKAKRANDEIKRQADLVEALERSYKELDEIMDESFGTDYIQNYRTQLAMLNAEVEAYRAQAAAERSKGKKADEDKALEYERNAEEALKRAAEATKTMQETFAGSSLASAAESFTDAWLSAYREFGDTAGAIEERMEDMVNNLVEKAALSGIVQAIMGGWYQSLSEIKDWNAQSIAEKVREARDLIPIINQGLGIAASELEAAGVDLRGTVGQFTGIKRDIANATEESITGLAAGINTQNFYMQHIDMNVAAILSALTGGTTATGASVTGEYVDPYKDTMLSYVGSLPQMRDDMASIRAMLEKVIRPNGAPAQHYVAVKM